MIQLNRHNQEDNMLSSEEKEQLQRIITEQNKVLAGAPSFAEKRAAQKAKLEAMTKLGMIPEKTVI